MADDLDVEAMLEAPVDENTKDSGYEAALNGLAYDSPKRSGRNGIKEHDRDREKDRDRERKRKSRSRTPKRKRSKDRERRSRSRDHEKRRRSDSRERSHRDRRRRRSSSRSRRSRSPRDRHRSSSRERRSEKERRRSRSRENYSRGGDSRHSRRSPVDFRGRDRYYGGRYHGRSGTPTKEDLPIEERDQRTVFCMQLAARVRQRDIEEFFSAVGKVREVRLIMDNRTRRHKGIAYIEFVDIESVGKAIALTGTRLCGVPVVVQHSQAEKNRLAQQNALAKQSVTVGRPGTGNPSSGPMNLYVGSLHFNITEDMLRGIFEPFGKVDKIELAREPETNRSKGYGFVHFREAEDAKKALDQLNGFELAGRSMKVNYVTDRSASGGADPHGPNALDSDELDRSGIDLGATGRLQLMAKLAEGTGIELPQAAVTALQFTNATSTSSTLTNGGSQNGTSSQAIPIATQCFLLTNMFDPNDQSNPADWADEIRNDVIEECRKHGGVLHVFVDQSSDEGHVYVKCASIASATATVGALHGRWFAGRLITAAFVPVMHYHNLFPESAVTNTPL